MKNTNTMLVSRLAALRAFLDKFFLSDYYIALLGALSFTGWLSGFWVPFIFVMLVLTIIMFCVCQNTMPVFPLMWFFLYTVSTSQEDIGKYWWMLFVILPLVASMVYNLIRNKPDLKAVLSPHSIKRSTLSMLLLLIPMGLGGLFKSDRNATGAIIVLLLTAVLALTFAYYMAVFKDRKGDKNDILRYMVKVMFVSGLIVLAEIAVSCMRTGSMDALRELIKHKSLNLGWSTPNPAAAAIMLGIPSNFYFMLKRSKFAFVYAIIAVLQYAAIVITTSRGALLFAGLALPFMLWYTLKKSPNRKQLIAVWAIVAAAGAVVAGVYHKQILDTLSLMIGRGASDNGRFDIYLFGLKVFANNPIFGAGWDFGIGSQHVGYSPYLFHSTIIQIIACSGIIGAIVYGYYYYARYSTFFKTAVTPETLTILAAMVIFEAYGIIDPIVFIPPTFFIMLLTLSAAVEQAAPPQINRALFASRLADRLRKRAGKDKPQG